MELTGVAGLVLCSHVLNGQLCVSQSSAQADPTLKRMLYFVVVALSKGSHSGGVALLGRLPPQDLLNPLGEAVPAGKGGRLPAYGRLVAIQMHLAWHKESSSQTCSFLFIQHIYKQGEIQSAFQSSNMQKQQGMVKFIDRMQVFWGRRKSLAVSAHLAVTTGSTKVSRLGGLSRAPADLGDQTLTCYFLFQSILRTIGKTKPLIWTPCFYIQAQLPKKALTLG